MAKLPPMAAIRVFEAAARLEHFSGAAEELGMTQAAVSYQIRQLEEILGDRLFRRENGRVRLSATGRRLHGPISEAFVTMRQAFGDLDEESNRQLSVSAPVSYGSKWLAAGIGRFQMRHPDLALRFSLTNDLVDFARNDFDVAIRLGFGHWPGLKSDFLFRIHVTPMCSPEFIERHQIRTKEDLLRVDRLDFEHELWAGWFEAAGLDPGLAVQRGIAFENQAQEGTAAQEGFGVALMTPIFWQRELKNGSLVQPFDLVTSSRMSHYVVYPERRVGIRKIERFKEWLREELAAEGELIPEEALTPPE